MENNMLNLFMESELVRNNSNMHIFIFQCIVLYILETKKGLFACNLFAKIWLIALEITVLMLNMFEEDLYLSYETKSKNGIFGHPYRGVPP